MGEMRNVYKIFGCGSLKERDHSEDLGVDRIILKWVFGKSGLECGLGYSGSG
jgi:hypothetical protein